MYITLTNDNFDREVLESSLPMVVFFEAGILNREAWSPNSEIAEVRFFSRAELPPLHYRQAARFDDAFEGRRGVVRVFDTEEPPE